MGIMGLMGILGLLEALASGVPIRLRAVGSFRGLVEEFMVVVWGHARVGVGGQVTDPLLCFCPFWGLG